MSAVNAPRVVKVRCHYCQGFRSPLEVVTMSCNVVMCWRCYEWHQEALYVQFQQRPPKGCQECNLSYAELEARAPDGNVRIVLVPKDGLYQVMCGTCSDAYLPKRVELFKGTQFGQEHLKVSG